MRIAVLGTGVVGKTLAARLVELGHEVVVGTRDPGASVAKDPQLSDFVLKAFAEAAADGEVIINATSGGVAIDALTSAGSANLAGKVLVDISNPLDFSQGFPPTLFVKDDDSLGEVIQREFPEARVVKTLNTLTADLMVHPESLAGGDHTIFMSGNEDAAKSVVRDLLGQIGWADVIDLGDISTARGTEMVLPLWLRLMGKLGTASFNFKVVR